MPAIEAFTVTRIGPGCFIHPLVATSTKGNHTVVTDDPADPFRVGQAMRVATALRRRAATAPTALVTVSHKTKPPANDVTDTDLACAVAATFRHTTDPAVRTLIEKAVFLGGLAPSGTVKPVTRLADRMVCAAAWSPVVFVPRSQARQAQGYAVTVIGVTDISDTCRKIRDLAAGRALTRGPRNTTRHSTTPAAEVPPPRTPTPRPAAGTHPRHTPPTDSRWPVPSPLPAAAPADAADAPGAAVTGGPTVRPAGAAVERRAVTAQLVLAVAAAGGHDLIAPGLTADTAHRVAGILARAAGELLADTTRSTVVMLDCPGPEDLAEAVRPPTAAVGRAGAGIGASVVVVTGYLPAAARRCLRQLPQAGTWGGAAAPLQIIDATADHGPGKVERLPGAVVVPDTGDLARLAGKDQLGFTGAGTVPPAAARRAAAGRWRARGRSAASNARVDFPVIAGFLNDLPGAGQLVGRLRGLPEPVGQAVIRVAFTLADLTGRGIPSAGDVDLARAMVTGRQTRNRRRTKP
ncbi:hypothetical protein ACFSSC_05230 [Corynebacterium mendelii]|uniref:Uncharacterized protein n=1 Tax=Corynebacterium mendelii TaxID=2765362 RepID=A0A939DYL3_9CORY|nr:hypothetical protein [Corynebacterium mendelii]MBN9643199.1 hypothetical protein [Corynebacterium mendelii]